MGRVSGGYPGIRYTWALPHEIGAPGAIQEVRSRRMAVFCRVTGLSAGRCIAAERVSERAGRLGGGIGGGIGGLPVDRGTRLGWPVSRLADIAVAAPPRLTRLGSPDAFGCPIWSVPGSVRWSVARNGRLYDRLADRPAASAMGRTVALELALR